MSCRDQVKRHWYNTISQRNFYSWFGSDWCSLCVWEQFKQFPVYAQQTQLLVYYFGEYLSQGSLKIENKCQVIPANILFEQNQLHHIQPKFAEFAHIHHHTVGGKPPWVKEVNQLHNTLQPGNKLPILPENEMSGCLQAIERIIKYVASD